MVEIKALACELPVRRGLPLAHWSLNELRRAAMEHGVVAQISGTTLWRWLSQDALRPWRHRYWNFPRDPAFAVKAGRILDLYQRRWQDKPLGPRDYVLCADEKTSIQARRRKHPSLSPAPGRPIYVEHEYARTGACAYIAAWDVHRAKLFGRCERKTGIAPFERLVAQIMREEPYRSPICAPSVLDHRQRLLASRPTRRQSFADQMAKHHSRPHAASRQLAQPDRGLFFDRPAQGSQPQRLLRARRSQKHPHALSATL
jgi:hypothetical protein